MTIDSTIEKVKAGGGTLADKLDVTLHAAEGMVSVLLAAERMLDATHPNFDKSPQVIALRSVVERHRETYPPKVAEQPAWCHVDAAKPQVNRIVAAWLVNSKGKNPIAIDAYLGWTPQGGYVWRYAGLGDPVVLFRVEWWSPMFEGIGRYPEWTAEEAEWPRLGKWPRP